MFPPASPATSIVSAVLKRATLTALACLILTPAAIARRVDRDEVDTDIPWKKSVPLTAVSPAGLPVGKLVVAARRSRNADIRKILASTPARPGDRVERQMWDAVCLQIEKRYEDANAAFDRIPNLTKAPVIVRAKAANSYAQDNQLDKAAKLCSSILAQYEMADAYKIRAGCYAAQNKLVEAASDFDKLADMEKESSSGLYSRSASLYLKAGKIDQAMAVLEKADKSPEAPTSSTLLMVRTDCYKFKGQWQNAINCLNKVIKLNASGPVRKREERDFILSTCYKERAKCYRKIGRNDLADADMKTLSVLGESVMDEIVGRH
jgi:tetratricopeptide (TPR) repeat protein